MKVIAIAGGSGAGKSTLTYSIIDKYPEIFEALHLDDYQKWRTESNLPMVDGMINFDHPDIIHWSKIIEDINLLAKGKEVKILTWGHRPDFDNSNLTERISRTMYPKRILIIDGYLSLWDTNLRNLFDRKYFLDLVEDKRLRRRTKFINPKYKDKILIPMHNQYIEPTRKYSDMIFNTEDLNPDEISIKIIDDLKRENLY